MSDVVSCMPPPHVAQLRAPDWVGAGARIGGSASGSSPLEGPLQNTICELSSVRLAEVLAARPVVGLLADNGPAWLLSDLALQATGAVVVPIPGFFTRDQIAHLIQACSMNALVCANAPLAVATGFDLPIGEIAGLHVAARRCPPRTRAADAIPVEVTKVTFTSGTTGAPRGVLLTFEQQLRTTRGLAALMQPLSLERHLCVLPLPVLLENVAGAYTAWMLGGECVAPPLAEVGLRGSSQFEPRQCIAAIDRHRPDSLIVMPQMLRALVDCIEQQAAQRAALASLRFVAVGGTATPPALIARARALGLPVHEGYGLSECAAVVTLNVPGADRPGTVGCGLPGIELRLSPDGEVEVSGRAFAGYLGRPSGGPRTWLATGDLGTIDAQGYLTIVGRRKNVLITGFGRNVSPEWPEGLLCASPLVAQAVVVGDGQPALAAILVPARPDVDDNALARLIESVNASLPDYARIGPWLRADAPFSPIDGLATANGRPRRDAIARDYGSRLAAAYRAHGGGCAPLVHDRLGESA